MQPLYQSEASDLHGLGNNHWSTWILWITAGIVGLVSNGRSARGEALSLVDVEGQPLAANVARLLDALEYLGASLPPDDARSLREAIDQRDAQRLQKLLDTHVLLCVSLNPESRVKVQRGPGPARLQQAGFVPHIVKIINESTVTKQMRINSPQSGPVYAGASLFTLRRQQQTDLESSPRSTRHNARFKERFLSVAMFQDPPMTRNLSGLGAEYALALIYSSESGKREATIGFDVGQGTEDLGFRGQAPVLFDVLPAIPVTLKVRDENGRPTVARLEFRDKTRVYPPQAKRLAPDFFFQPHIYRSDGEIVLLPPGTFSMSYSRGPEYVVLKRTITIPQKSNHTEDVRLKRWVNPNQFGYFSGDHHIHAAGCAHYTSPTQGVEPKDMFRQVKGEGLNVGCVLTWGPCFDHQRRFFSASIDQISEPHTLLKYDLEISGFGSQALGHVCLLNLKNQEYPGSDGSSRKGWPTWATPVMRWAKQQGGITGYAHSASGLAINPSAAARRLLKSCDADEDGQLDRQEAKTGLLPEPFLRMDVDQSLALTFAELTASHERVSQQLPNLAIPEMNGVGAMEICVSVVEGVCDFISAMDTPRIQEWNMWYHILNCGFPLKVSGETDFPCMSSRRVGQGRVYVQMGEVRQIEFDKWCRNLAAGRSYVSDGYAHPLVFRVNGVAPGTQAVQLEKPDDVVVQARVVFAKEMPLAVAHGGIVPRSGRRVVGDTVVLHGPRTNQLQRGGERQVELIVNGRVAATRRIPADGKVHDVEFKLPIRRSSWVALRSFPQFHTNPIDVKVNHQPFRASTPSARWCAETIRLLWHNRNQSIRPSERAAAERAFNGAIAHFEKLARTGVPAASPP